MLSVHVGERVMKTLKVCSLGLTALLLSGCLTVTRGASDDIVVNSVPDGAFVSAVVMTDSKDGMVSLPSEGAQLQCQSTPCAVTIPRTKHARISVNKEGFHPINFMVLSKGSSPTSSIRPGTIVAGEISGSHVIAGSPKTLTRYVPGNTMVLLQAGATYGIGTAIDVVSGANRSFSPNPVTVMLAPLDAPVTEQEDTP